MPIKVDIEGGIVIDHFNGVVTFRDVLECLKTGWEQSDWDNVSLRLAIIWPGVDLQMDDLDPTVLGRVFAPSVVGKRRFWHACALMEDRADIAKACRDFQFGMMKHDNVKTGIFVDIDAAHAWLDDVRKVT